MSKKNGKRDNIHQCEKCLPAFCCNYFSFEIDEPEDRQDYEILLWKLAHEKVSIYIDRNDWYLMVNNRCNFLTSDNKCAIYDHRPYICRKHSTENCEYSGDNYGFSEHFKSYDDRLMYIKENTNYRFRQEPTGVRPNCL